MNQRRNLGPLLFLVVIIIYAGAMFLAAKTIRREAADAKAWAGLEAAQSRLALRAFFFAKYLDSQGEASYSPNLNELLRTAAQGWEEASRSNPRDLQLRFALAVVQRQLGENAAKTVLAAPVPGRIPESKIGPRLQPEREFDRYLLLRTLILDDTPDADILNIPQVTNFIRENPARRLWLASLYSRLGREKEAEREWRLGYQESAPYAIAALAILAVWWVALPLAGIVCAFTLLRGRERPQPPMEAGVSTPPAGGQRIGLAPACLAFLLWLAAVEIIAGLVSGAVGIPLWPPAGAASALVQLFSSALATLLAVGALRLAGRGRFSVGWKFAPLGFNLRVGLTLFLLSPVVTGVARLLQNYTGAESREPSLLLFTGAESLPLRALLVIGACVIAPAAEETVFRGLLFRGLRAQWGLAVGMLLSSAVFAAGHLDLISAAPLFIFALGLAWSVERTGSVVPAALAHALFNLFPLLLLNVMTM